jgi:RNA polymerase sigma factor (sigma-70 family)
MPTEQLRGVLRPLRRAALLRDGDPTTDGRLLNSFVSRRDEAAFEALLRRHGPMVLGVCRRLLRHPQDAEDAFQAVFLVLTRKAASIAQRGLLGNWLYGVAYRTALDARAAAARRRARERPLSALPEPEAAGETDLSRDLRPLLDEELHRLPDKYRVPVVLCDLEGRTRKEAARQLGVPEGTLSGRLTTARRLLARRLARHGPMLGGAAPAGPLSGVVASAGLPKSLVGSTVKAATLVAAGQALTAGLVSAPVTALTEGVLNAMFLTKLKLAAVFVLLLGACGVAAGVAAYRVRASEQAGPAPVAKTAKAPATPKATLRPATLLEQARQAADGIKEDHEKIATLLAIAEAQRAGGEKAAAARTYRDALRIAKVLPEGKKDHFLTTIAGSQARAGDFEGAGQTAAAIKDGNHRDFALASIGHARTRAGDVKGALRAAQGVSPTQQATLLGAVAAAQAEAGKAKEAGQTLALIDGDYPRALALLGVARAHLKAKDRVAAGKSLQEAVGLVEGLDLEGPYRVARAYLAEAQAELGDVKKARQTADATPDERFKEMALGKIVAVQARAGDVKGALATAGAIKGKDRKGAALMHVLRAQLRSGDLKGAQETGRALRGSPLHDVRSRGEIARAQAKAGDRAAAARSFKEAFEAVKGEDVGALCLLVEAQAEAGEEKSAYDLAVKQRSPLLKAEALLSVARGLLARREAEKRP